MPATTQTFQSTKLRISSKFGENFAGTKFAGSLTSKILCVHAVGIRFPCLHGGGGEGEKGEESR